MRARGLHRRRRPDGDDQLTLCLRPTLLFVVCGLSCTGGDGSDKDTDATPDGEAELLGILIQPEDVVLPLGQELQLEATGLRADRSADDVTAAVSWTSTDPDVARVSDRLDEEGIIEGLSVGSAEITAKLGGVVSVPLTVDVTDAELLGLQVEPSAVTVPKGGHVQLQATAAFSDGSASDANAQVRWITADGGIATVDKGKVSGVAVGTAAVHADWSGVESESVVVEVVASAEADLTVKSITATGQSGSAVITVRVENTGSTGASDFYVDVFLDDPSASVGDYGDGYDEIGWLAGGASKDVSFLLEDAGGDHTITAVVDTDNRVDETSEGNNVLVRTVNVPQSSSLRADLSIDDFGVFESSGSLFYWVEVANYSSNDAGPFYVDLFLDPSRAPTVGDNGDEYEQIDGLDAWESTEIEFFVNQTCGGCTSYVLVDSTGDVDEVNEFDNTASVTVDSWGDDTGWQR